MKTWRPSQRPDATTILIVEDDESIGDFLSIAITQETAYQAVLVRDGWQGVHVAQSLHPALLITDYRLPSLNGLELLDRIHADPVLENLPALLISASLPKRELEQRHLIGIEKPIDLETFLQTVARLLSSSSPQRERRHLHKTRIQVNRDSESLSKHERRSEKRR